MPRPTPSSTRPLSVLPPLPKIRQPSRVCHFSQSHARSSAHVLAAAAAFAELIVKEADNNVKLIVLDRFDTLRAKHEHVLDGMVMDILKVLSSQDMEVKRKAIGIALEMVTSRNVEDVVLFMKKQLTSTMEQEYDKVSITLHTLRAMRVWLTCRTSSTVNS